MQHLKILLFFTLCVFNFNSNIRAQSIKSYHIGSVLNSKQVGNFQLLQGNCITHNTNSNGLHYNSQFIQIFKSNDTKNILKFNIFPNPTDGFINIISTEKIQKITVTDISNREVINTITNRIDMSNLSNGAYTITISTNSQYQESQIILLNK